MTVTEIITLLTGVMTIVVVPILTAYFAFRLNAIKLQNERGEIERAKNTATLVDVKNTVATKDEIKIVHDAVNSLNAEAIKKTAEQAKIQQDIAVSTATLMTEKSAIEREAKVDNDNRLAAQVLADKNQVEKDALLASKVGLEKQLLLKQQQEHPDRDPGLLKD